MPRLVFWNIASKAPFQSPAQYSTPISQWRKGWSIRDTGCTPQLKRILFRTSTRTTSCESKEPLQTPKASMFHTNVVAVQFQYRRGMERTRPIGIYRQGTMQKQRLRHSASVDCPGAASIKHHQTMVSEQFPTAKNCLCQQWVSCIYSKRVYWIHLGPLITIQSGHGKTLASSSWHFIHVSLSNHQGHGPFSWAVWFSWLLHICMAPGETVSLPSRKHTRETKCCPAICYAGGVATSSYLWWKRTLCFSDFLVSAHKHETMRAVHYGI